MSDPTGTPAEAMLAVVSDVFRDKMPKLAPVALVRRALLAGADVYQPMRSELAGRLAANTNMDVSLSDDTACSAHCLLSYTKIADAACITHCIGTQ